MIYLNKNVIFINKIIIYFCILNVFDFIVYIVDVIVGDDGMRLQIDYYFVFIQIYSIAVNQIIFDFIRYFVNRSICGDSDVF